MHEDTDIFTIVVRLIGLVIAYQILGNIIFSGYCRMYALDYTVNAILPEMVQGKEWLEIYQKVEIETQKTKCINKCYLLNLEFFHTNLSSTFYYRGDLNEENTSPSKTNPIYRDQHFIKWLKTHRDY